MCRLFGFKSVLQSHIHESLVSADNAIGKLSEEHPDGWGVAYYVENSPHIIKSANKAIEDKIFQKVSGVVSSHTVLAHVRNATLGEKSVLNTHPFQYGPWVFAHNGNIKDFKEHKTALMMLIAPRFIRFILGTTDSEVLFFILLTEITKNSNYKLAVAKAISAVTKVVGDFERDNDKENIHTFLSFILTNGRSMLAFNGGKTLHYSTHKSRCPERDTCNFFNDSCEQKSDNNSQVNHLIVSSEPLQGINLWYPTLPGELIQVDEKMMFSKEKLFS